MGLIDLQTDLKSLKYGKDRVGGGASEQPFVQKPIPDSFSAVGNTGGLDVLTRGGTLAIGRTADDVSRLTKLLLTGATFQGPFFTVKQNVLSRQGVQTQASPKGLNEGAYLPNSTLTQVKASATGLHFNKQGVNPIPGLAGSLTTYSDVVTYKQEISDNRLVNLTDSFVSSKTAGNTLRSYPGGPGSILGFGKTNIKVPVEQRTGRNGINYNPDEDRIKLYPTTYTKTAPAVGEYDFLGNIDIEANQFGSPTLLNATNTTEVTVNGPESIRKTNNYANLNFLVPTSTLAGITIDSAKSYQVSMPGTTRNIKIINAKTAPKGDQASGVNFNANSIYAISSSLEDYELHKNSSTPNGLYSGSKPSPEELAMGTTPFSGDADFTKPTAEYKKQTQVLDNLGDYTYTKKELIDAPSYRQTREIQDFRTAFRDKGGEAKAVGADVLAPDYTEENIELRVHLGNPGIQGDVSDYTRGKVSLVTDQRLGALDTLNALPLYQSANVAPDSEKDVNDLVKFRIAVLDPGGSSTKTFIHFRAFLDTITDNYNADWSSHRYVGRGENFWTYQGFDRNISLGWTVYAQSKEELIPMYKKLNYLASSLAPNYNNGFMRGLLCQLTIGGYVYEQPGFIKGFSYELSEQSTWEIGINDKGFTDPENRGDDLVKELPHMIKVTGFQFVPIHTFIPQVQDNTYDKDGNVATYGNERYIALSNGVESANNYGKR